MIMVFGITTNNGLLIRTFLKIKNADRRLTKYLKRCWKLLSLVFQVYLIKTHYMTKYRKPRLSNNINLDWEFSSTCVHTNSSNLIILYTWFTQSNLFWSLNFPRAAILKCDVDALRCQTPTRSLQLFLSRVETGTTTQLRHISRWRPAGNSVTKSLNLKYI